MRRNQVEFEIQRAIVLFLRSVLPENSVVFHVPNGGSRKTSEAARFKAMGVVAGVADLIVLTNGRPIAIEVKGPKGRLSVKQKEWATQWVEAGGVHMTVTSIDDVAIKLVAAGVPLRMRLII